MEGFPSIIVEALRTEKPSRSGRQRILCPVKFYAKRTTAMGISKTLEMNVIPDAFGSDSTENLKVFSLTNARLVLTVKCTFNLPNDILQKRKYGLICKMINYLSELNGYSHKKT